MKKNVNINSSNKKLRVGILFGGKSAEHEVSLQSAKSVLEALDKNKYIPILIGIDKSGKWQLHDESAYLLHSENPQLIALNASGREITLAAGNTSRELISIGTGVSTESLDVIFPVLHGPYGEDGSMQGLLKLADIPFVGPGVLGSAIGMDKDVMKRLLKEVGIPVTKFIALHRHDVILSDLPAGKAGTKNPQLRTNETLHSVQNDKQFSYIKIVEELGLPFFVKPANLGSSVGVVKVHDESEFKSALNTAFQYDTKILIEQMVEGREIECSVLGNENPIASVPGEVIPHHEFYDYEAKYIDENGAGLEIPANLSEIVKKKVQELAIKSFRVLCCEGMARVDFFVSKNDEVIVNEINTIPGFTKISMYPKLWEASGVSYHELIDQLIQLALARHTRDKKLKTFL